jgi:ubiquinone/menaquinone biosynthesis C-methylase UbiE
MAVAAEEQRGWRASFAEHLHGKARQLRDDRIVAGIAGLVPSAQKMLDVGASDGRIAVRVAERVGATIEGIDVELQPDARIPVTVYDGTTFPFADDQYDLVTIVDVLHHAGDPRAVLAEALRVTRPEGCVVIKDHVRRGRWSNVVLLTMDNSSNFGVHENTSGTYLTSSEWDSLLTDAGGRVEQKVWPFKIHDLPWRLFAPSSYHLLLQLRAA